MDLPLPRGGVPRAHLIAKGAAMIRTNNFLVLAVILSGAAPADAVELQDATVQAWQEYVRCADARMQARLDAKEPFLWIDESADRTQRTRRGEILVTPLAGQGTQNVPSGLIHHWIGATFIPGVTIENLLAVVHDYSRYSEIYKPVVVDSRSLTGDTTDPQFSMIWQRRVLFVNAAMQGRYRVHEFVVDSSRKYGVVDATLIQQIKEYRHPSEHLLPPDTGDGFMWRIHNISRYEQRDGGVYLEIEAMALTRDIPTSLGWLVTPVVNRLSINSLRTTLSQTREAVAAQRVTLAKSGRSPN
jgi:hypothetical protein